MEWDTRPRASQGPRTVQTRQSLEDRRAIRWQWRFDTPPKPPNTVPTGASFLGILLLVTRYGKPQWFSKIHWHWAAPRVLPACFCHQRNFLLLSWGAP